VREWTHCPLCGEPLSRREIQDRPRSVCGCGFIDWRNPVPAAALMLIREEELLWVRRAGEPNKGQWSLPSGFQEWDEDIEVCARRELEEETGLTAGPCGLVGAYSAFDDPRHNALLVVFHAPYAGGEAVAGDDADDARWFPLSAPPEPIAWATHRRALDDLRRRLGAD